MRPDEVIEASEAAHRRLLASVDGLGDEHAWLEFPATALARGAPVDGVHAS